MNETRELERSAVVMSVLVLAEYHVRTGRLTEWPSWIPRWRSHWQRQGGTRKLTSSAHWSPIKRKGYFSRPDSLDTTVTGDTDFRGQVSEIDTDDRLWCAGPFSCMQVWGWEKEDTIRSLMSGSCGVVRMVERREK